MAEFEFISLRRRKSWHFAPLMRDEAMGHPFGEFEKTYVDAGPHRIGRIYKKAIYREYTDAKFNRLMPRARSTVASTERSRTRPQ
jgi:hypothetical protein